MPPAPSLTMPLASSTAAIFRPVAWAWPIVAVLSLTLVLMVPALWNGYPILYFDSVDYLSLGFTWRIPIYRTAGYGFFAFAGWSTKTVWATLALQSLFVAYVLYESWRLFLPEVRGWRLALLLAIALVLTSLPWVTSSIMPDAFTAPAILLAMMLAMRDDALSPRRRWIFVGLLAIALMTHPTHVAVMGGLVVCIFVIDWLAKRGWPFARMKVRFVAAGLVLGIVLSIAANWAATGRVFFAPRTTSLLTFAVLFERGLGQRYLEETCGQPGVRQSVLCPFRTEMPADANEFLWHNPNFWKAGGWSVLLPESAKDLQDILQRYPLEFLSASATLMGEQLVVIKTGEGFRSMVGFTDSEIRRFYPKDYDEFMMARQQSYKELSDSPMPLVNAVHVPVMLAGILLLIAVLALALKRRDRTGSTLAALVLLAYLGNAFVCGAVSNPADRYGSRMAWLAALTAVVLLPRVLSAAGRERSSAAG
jgi:hypothetical protein